MDGQPIRTEINNGVLSSTNAMPLKNLTSDNTQSFSNNRQLFQNAYQPPVNYSLRQTTRSFFQRSTGALPHGYVVDGPKSVFQKKWIGGNRDASQTAMRRRYGRHKAVRRFTGPLRRRVQLCDHGVRARATPIRYGHAMPCCLAASPFCATARRSRWLHAGSVPRVRHI